MRKQIVVVGIQPHDDAVMALINALDAYQSALYPAESNHLDGLDVLAQPNVYLVGARVSETGDLVGIGAVKKLDGYGEIKRVFVDRQYRGLGLSLRIMSALESHLLTEGYTVVRLETGIRQPEALGLYRRLGYIETGPFGNYTLDPFSVFMEKRL